LHHRDVERCEPADGGDVADRGEGDGGAEVGGVGALEAAADHAALKEGLSGAGGVLDLRDDLGGAEVEANPGVVHVAFGGIEEGVEVAVEGFVAVVAFVVPGAFEADDLAGEFARGGVGRGDGCSATGAGAFAFELDEVFEGDSGVGGGEDDLAVLQVGEGAVDGGFVDLADDDGGAGGGGEEQ
jgi:hypothetical protein